MSFTNTPERYGVISAALHWLSAIIVYGMFALGLWMVTLSYYWICPYISRHLLSLNPLLACCRRYSRGER